MRNVALGNLLQGRFKEALLTATIKDFIALFLLVVCITFVIHMLTGGGSGGEKSKGLLHQVAPTHESKLEAPSNEAMSGPLQSTSDDDKVSPKPEAK
ncbi:hypothetical protein V6259_12815 [Marinomonas sp. TI.3.20]|uniref:hypothetical protein n=1 Tax=Marinomonas sp. TI.3.20 TaxID=3121296 RepID=UPI00311EA3F1